MVRKLHGFGIGAFLLLSLLSLFVVGYDFTCGHTFDEVMSLEYCPVCDAFHSADKVAVFLIDLLLVGSVVFLGIASIYCTLFPSDLYLTLFALRAPPVSSCCR